VAQGSSRQDTTASVIGIENPILTCRHCHALDAGLAIQCCGAGLTSRRAG
jgi:hypothetical protein